VSSNLEINVRPIGIVRVSASDDEVRDSWISEGVEGIVEVLPEFEAGLEGIDGFSHIILVTWLHKIRPEHRSILKVRPKRLARFGIPLRELPLVGVFTTDSPVRPNPIGISIVELIRRSGRFLYVRGLDLFDGTPVLDIKAYTPDRAVSEIRVPEWYLRTEQIARKYLGKDVRI